LISIHDQIKYSHAAHATVLASTYDKDNNPNVAVSVIMANFPKGRGNKPPLFKRDDVKTFFHEFGHAMHALLGRTHMASFAGTAVKRDFVELPSQMLEEWLCDKGILKIVSSHYETGQSMPDDLIDRIMAMKHVSSGAFVQRQAALSLLALDYFLEGANKDVRQIAQDVQSKVIKNIAYAPDTNFYASFGHLSGYASKYYGYLWSRVFGLDMFYEIKKTWSFKSGDWQTVY
jgi:thimet oligopeptidase